MATREHEVTRALIRLVGRIEAGDRKVPTISAARDSIFAVFEDEDDPTQELRALVIDLANELEAEVYGRYRPDDDLHPAMERRFDRDMETVRRARRTIGGAP